MTLQSFTGFNSAYEGSGVYLDRASDSHCCHRHFGGHFVAEFGSLKSGRQADSLRRQRQAVGFGDASLRVDEHEDRLPYGYAFPDEHPSIQFGVSSDRHFGTWLLWDGYLDRNKDVFQCAEERVGQRWIRMLGSDKIGKFNFSYGWNDYGLNDGLSRCPIKVDSVVSPSDYVVLGDTAGEKHRMTGRYQMRLKSLSAPFVSLVALVGSFFIPILFIPFI